MAAPRGSFLVVVLFILLVHCNCKKPLYILDPLWPKEPSKFKGQIFSAAVDVNSGEVYVTQRGEGLDPVIVFSEDGEYKRSFPSNRSIIDTIHGSRMYFNASSNSSELWLTDIGNSSSGHTVKKFTKDGKLMQIIGTAGIAGTSLKPLQFDHVADLAFDTHGDMYIADGDGGLNNRIVKLDKNFNLVWHVGGGSGSGQGEFNIPHSIELDQHGQVWVADRKNNRTQVFDPEDGKYIGEWKDCFNNAPPYAIRLSADKSHFIVLELLSSRIIFIATPKKTGDPGKCKIIDQIQLAPDLRPHLVAVNQKTGAFYVAEIGGDACQKYVLYS
ncbi:NHL repeat-containing protein 3-like [Saccoglossus kowalevskii]|uniref:NHL repeat-containing protein 3-like n=1 Tax=Saccoglossus kowalevskii TaxID=10224 RepID=A0ABM0H1R0_SACKO|nr:PREDICTED: NHL repeat-containing protein 3-like [Saccoglossus kowalevskii]